MRSLLWSAVLLLTLVSTVHAADKAPAKSSAIPDRREFPVSPENPPCQDFYKYVCTKVSDAYELPADRSRHIFSFDDSAERILTAKKKYFNELTTLKPENEREQNMKTYYVACMDETSRKAEEQALVKETIDKVDALKNRDEFLTFLSNNRFLGESSSFSFWPIPDQQEPLMRDAAFSIEWISLPEKSFYEKPEVVADLQNVIEKFFVAIGDKQAKEKAAQIVGFEKSLAKVMLKPSEYQDLLNEKKYVSREKMIKNYPAFHLENLFSKISKRTKIRDMTPVETAALNKDLETMPLDQLKNIYLYNSLSGIMDDAYPEFFQTEFKFQNKNFGGPEARAPRNERCTKHVMEHFRPELDSVLWPKLFPNFPRDKFTALAEKIRASIISILKANTWLSAQARKEAIKKISTAYLQLVSPQNDEEWDFLAPGKYDLKKPVQNEREIARLGIEKALKQMNGPVSFKIWDMGPLTINAYYEPSANKFVLPVGILQYPFYDANAPESNNLAAIGSVIGHELGHSIDDHGSKYDEKGRLRAWMTKADLANFKKRTGELIEQFNKAGHDGKLTLGENIGDLVGVTASHYASFGPGYKPENEKAEQEYFASYARDWCAVMRPKYAELQLKQNPHALSFARVNEQIKQQPAFREAFHCKSGDPMLLPQDKLTKVW